jgi:hypothetical protein
MSVHEGEPSERVDLGDKYGEDDPLNELRFPVCWTCQHGRDVRTLLVRQKDGLHCPTCPDELRPIQMWTGVSPQGEWA